MAQAHTDSSTDRHGGSGGATVAQTHTDSSTDRHGGSLVIHCQPWVRLAKCADHNTPQM